MKKRLHTNHKHRGTFTVAASLLSSFALSASFAGCQKKKSSTEAEEETTVAGAVVSAGGGGGSSKVSASKAKSVDSSIVSSLTKELALSNSLSIIPAKSSGSSLHLLGTEYEDAVSNLYVQDDSFEALDSASGIYCFVNKLGYVDMVNQGKYLAQVDEDECFEKKGGSSDSSDSQQGVVEYTNVIVDSVREEGKPLKVDFWLANGDSDEFNLHGKLTIAEGATKKNPIGVFRLNWVGKENGSGGLEAFGDESGNIVVRMAENSEREGNKFELSLGALLQRDATTEEISGGKMTSKIDENWEGQAKNSQYKVAFNSDRMLRQGAAGEKCFDRNEFYTNAWNYNLYEKENGKLVKINSGFPLEYRNAQNKLVRAHIGYHGLWAEGNETIPAGATVSRITDFKTNAKQDYTVVKSNGKLMKNTRIELQLAEITGIDLGAWNQASQKQVRVSYDGTKFQKTGEFTQGTQGGSWTDTTAEDFTLSSGQNWFWSEGLGNVMILVADGAVSKVIITTNEDVTASAGNLSLSCVSECPVAAITSAMVGNTAGATPFSPDRDSPSLSNAVAFEYSQAEMALKRGGTSVDFASDVSLSSSQRFKGGVRSGPLLVASEATSLLAFHTSSVFYTWEMGQDNWNKFTGIKDSTGAIVKFDAPIQFAYTHKQAYDADGRGKDFYDKKFRLNYGGPGQLWGIPSEKSTQGWYAPLFSISSGSAVGPSDKYLVKIINGEQRMKEASSCAGLDLQGVPTLPAKADLKPVTWVDAPSAEDLIVEVIDGEILAE